MTGAAQNREKRQPRRRGCLLVLLLAILAGLLAAALGCRPLLHAAARYLVVEQPPRPADIVVVHAGEPGRVEWGLELVQKGHADHILVFLDPRYAGGFFGLTADQAAELTRTALVEGGLRQEQITLIRSVYSTWDEGNEAMRYLAAHREMRRVLIVSSPFHMRRVRAVWMELQKGAPQPLELTFVPVPWDRANVHVEDWWTREEELIWVQSEYIKLILYRLKHFD